MRLTVAPPRSLPGVVALTSNSSVVIVPSKLLIVSVGRGSVPVLLYSKPSALTGRRV